MHESRNLFDSHDNSNDPGLVVSLLENDGLDTELDDWEVEN